MPVVTHLLRSVFFILTLREDSWLTIDYSNSMQTADHALTKELLNFDILSVTEKVEQRKVSSVAVETRNFHFPCWMGR